MYRGPRTKKPPCFRLPTGRTVPKPPNLPDVAMGAQLGWGCGSHLEFATIPFAGSSHITSQFSKATRPKAGMPADARPSMFKSRPSTAIWQGEGFQRRSLHRHLGKSIEIPIEIHWTPIEIFHLSFDYHLMIIFGSPSHVRCQPRGWVPG